MIKRVEINFDENPHEASLVLNFDSSNTNTMYIDDFDDEIQKESWLQQPTHKCSQYTLKKLTTRFVLSSKASVNMPGNYFTVNRLILSALSYWKVPDVIYS